MGAAPLTKKCLESKQIWWEFGDADDKINNVAKMLDEANRVSCHLLSTNGYNGDALRVEVKKVQKQMVTVPHLQERIALIAESKSHVEQAEV